MINLCYGDGKIFVPVKTNNMDDGTGVVKAHLRVFDADTLEQLYITDDAMATSDTQTAVMYLSLIHISMCIRDRSCPL